MTLGKAPRTHYGYLCEQGYTDYDGKSQTASWIEPAKNCRDPIPDSYRIPDSLGWWAECIIEPEMHFVGPFETEEQAIAVATEEEAFFNWIHQDDDEEPVYAIGHRAGNC